MAEYTRTSFVKTFYPLCKKLEDAGGLNAVMSVAQAIYEGASGNSNISKKCNNCFGITTSGSGYKTGPNKYGNYHTWRIFNSLGNCFEYHDKMFAPGHTKIKAYQDAYPYRSNPSKFISMIAPTYCPAKDGGGGYAKNVVAIMADVKKILSKLGITDSTTIDTNAVYGNNGVSGGSGGSGGGGTSWASAVQQMGSWYANNVHSYSQSQSVDCGLIGKKVRTDCSGFTTACLILFGVNASGTSKSFTESSGGLYNTLSGAGFTQMDYSESALQPYDIMSYDGHVEVYAGNKKSYAWGNVHDTAHGGLPCGSADLPKYKKIWRNSNPEQGGDGSTPTEPAYEPTDLYTMKDVSVYGDMEDSFADLSKYANEANMEDDVAYEPLSAVDNTTGNSEGDGENLQDKHKEVTSNGAKVYPPILTQKMKPSIEISEHSWWALEEDKSEDKGNTTAGASAGASVIDNYSA